MSVIAEMTYDGFVLANPVKGAGKAAANTKLSAGTVVKGSRTEAIAICGASDTPWAILAEDIDTDAACGVVVYLAGEFDGNKLITDAESLTDTQVEALRDLGIFVKYGMD